MNTKARRLPAKRVKKTVEVKMFPKKKDSEESNPSVEDKKENKKSYQRRELTSDETKDQSKLKRIWDSKHTDLHLTQAQLAKDFGFKNQAAISQYLNGRIPLNMETVAKFAKALQVKVDEISPRFAEALPPVQPKDMVIKVTDISTLQFVKALNDSMSPIVNKGDLMAIDVNDASAGGMSLPTGKIVAVFRSKA